MLNDIQEKITSQIGVYEETAVHPWLRERNLKRPRNASREKKEKSDEDLTEKGTHKKPVLGVVMLGGITHLENAAFRALSASSTFPYRISIFTSHIVNGNRICK